MISMRQNDRSEHYCRFRCRKSRQLMRQKPAQSCLCGSPDAEDRKSTEAFSCTRPCTAQGGASDNTRKQRHRRQAPSPDTQGAGSQRRRKSPASQAAGAYRHQAQRQDGGRRKEESHWQSPVLHPYGQKPAFQLIRVQAVRLCPDGCIPA